MDKYDLRTFLFDKAYDYLKENPNKLSKEQEAKLLDAVFQLTNTLKKIECKELIDFLQYIGAIDPKPTTENILKNP